MKKICTKCGETKKTSEYFKDSQKKSGSRPECKKCTTVVCIKYAKGRRVENNWKNFKYKTGLTKEQFIEIEKLQKKKCAICFKKVDRLSLDHCHKTLKIRGLLCNRCNQGLGYFLDNIKNLKSAIKYLENPIIKDLNYRKNEKA